MKIYIRGWIHHKNEIAIRMMNGRGIDFYYNQVEDVEFDYLMLTDSFSVPNLEYKSGIIFGPHISLEKLGEHPVLNNSVFNSLSPWLSDLSKKLFPGNKYVTLPFPVDVDKFSPSEKKGNPVIYFKRRDPEILKNFISINSHINFKV